MILFLIMLFIFTGNKDKILPINFVVCDYVIENAGHFMTMTNADEISKLLQKII